MIVLELSQAGLSWATILAKRENYRRAFFGFDIARVARITPAEEAKLLQNAGIVRNPLKIKAAICNAQVVLRLQKEHGSFANFLYSFLPQGRPIRNAFTNLKQMPATTSISDALAKALKKEGMKFLGSTVMYAFMQSVGMVNDHMTNCFVYREVAAHGAVAPQGVNITTSVPNFASAAKKEQKKRHGSRGPKKAARPKKSSTKAEKEPAKTRRVIKK